MISLKMFKIRNISRNPRIMHKCSKLHFLALGRTPYFILIADFDSERNASIKKKLNVK